jgi:hypothetical protein
MKLFNGRVFGALLVCGTLVALPLSQKLRGASSLTKGQFTFSSFSISGTPPAALGSLAVEQISDLGEIAGYQVFTSATSDGYIRKPNGSVTKLNDPAATSGFTRANGLNVWGTVVGYYLDVAHNQYSGFFYNDGRFKTYNIPGLPAFSATVIEGINDFGAFCGYYQPAPAYNTVPFVNWFGNIDTNFPIPGSTFTECTAVTEEGDTAGTWVDASNVNHGFIRDWRGNVTIVDVPGAAFAGTSVIGLNDFGWASGHFWDSSNHEHGFLRSPHGHFYQIDVPNADKTKIGGGTAGGGVNNDNVVVGHYDPVGGGPELGYIAHPGREINDDEEDDK